MNGGACTSNFSVIFLGSLCNNILLVYVSLCLLACTAVLHCTCILQHCIPTLAVHVYLYSCVDAVLDRPITPNSDQYIVWAVGPRGTEDGLAYYHTQRTPNLQIRFRFGRTAADNCAALSCPSPPSCPYAQETFDVANMDATFVAVIGQSGGPRGYEEITGETQLPTAHHRYVYVL